MKTSLVFFAMAVSVCALGLTGCSTYTPPPSMDSTSQADVDLANEVMNRLDDDTLAGQFTFGISANEGIITVQGAIPDENMRTRVLGIIRGTPGVQGVIDKLYRM